MKALVSTITAVAATVALVTAATPPAGAAVQHGPGHATSPAQPYLGNPDASDWLGAYVVGGDQVFSVQYAHLAPDSDEQYQPGGVLKSKWGTDLPPDVAADISYLLHAHGDDTDNDTAAALAHLLLSWTAAPQNPAQLDPANDFRHIAYDAPFHLAKLPASAQQRVTQLTAEAASQRGPWSVTVVAPSGAQVGQAGVWSVHVEAASGDPVPGRPVTFSATGGTLASTTATLDAQGNASVTFTPSEAVAEVSATVEAPATQPAMHQAVQVDTARVVTGGGGIPVTETQGVTAEPGVFAPGPRATLTGRPRVGKLLTASAGTTVPTGAATFQWLAGQTVVGAGPTYRVALGDVGQQLRVVATVSRPGYTPASSTSEPTRAVKLAKATLEVAVRPRAHLGDRLLVRAQGLVPGEACRVRFGGVPVRSCRADAQGRVRVRIDVEGVAPGRRLVVLQGAIPRRRGTDTLRVVPRA